jgi:thiamine-phosphate pyrophosphorylase
MAEARPPSRLYLQIAATEPLRAEDIIAKIGDRACCVLLSPDAGSDAQGTQHLVSLAQSRDLACLIKDDVALAKSVGADGVHIPADPAIFADARRRLGGDATIGADCGTNRHDAMVIAEMGADYVAFGPNLTAVARNGDERGELIAWWSEIFVIPCIAWDVSTAEEAAMLAALGADFIALPQAFWESEDALTRAIEIDAVLRDGRRND